MFFLFIAEVASESIDGLIVLEEGSVDHLILDCPYDSAEINRKGLVVQWRHDSSSLPIYQWILSRKPTVCTFCLAIL